ncbi:D-arabinono-1,4-lactone oxidase-domain-containing protein [Mycena rosella]|uniref:D-arabinono-1,4-lactone oxidase n=1 Tax=Mycena rosella TaxID=1033263 RepID=A0AAD7D7K5_MYCRO|nr:D-arabinono-1,4-lactone oxidase-domain-containing protein [Mycena rosella]
MARHPDSSWTDPRLLSRAALVAALAPIAAAANAPWENWGRTFVCTPRALFRPTSVRHCRLALELARRDARVLRPAGIGHSPSDVACTNDYLLQMTAMNRVLRVDVAAQCVTAEAGITLTDLHAALAPHGLAMRNLGSISDQTLAGIVATATHGAGSAFGVMSTHVRALTILLPTGAVVRCSPTHRRDLFVATVCGLGATGLILTITLELEPAFRLKDTHTVLPFARAVAQLDALKASAEHVRFWWFPAVGTVRVSAMSRTDEPLRPAGSWFWDSLVGFHAVQLLLLLSRYARWQPLAFLLPLARLLSPFAALLLAPFFFLFAVLSPKLGTQPARDKNIDTATEKAPTRLQSLAHARPLNHANAWAARLACWLAGPGGVVVDESVNVFNIECRYLQHTTEWALPAARAQACLRALGAWLEGEERDAGGERAHFPIEVRFSAGDDIWLSPSSGGETCWIGIVQFKPYNLPTRYRALFAAFERILAAHGGRPHWAKAHHLDPRATRALYPDFPRFLEVVQAVDPTGVFRNEYIERHLMGGAGDGREYKRRRGGGESASAASATATARGWWPWAWAWGRRKERERVRDWRVAPEGRGPQEEGGEREEQEQEQEQWDEDASDADSEATLGGGPHAHTGKGADAAWDGASPTDPPLRPTDPPRTRTRTQ